MANKIKPIMLSSEIFTRGVEDVVAADMLGHAIASGKQLRVKLGIDATAPHLHIGHAASLWKIRALQEAGHKAVMILGDFTTRIGDPTGRSGARPLLTERDIRRNIAAISKQIGLILDVRPRVFELHKNSEWFGPMRLEAFLGLTAMMTHARLIERDMFRQRIREGKEIAVSEMLYPILQGYDSVAIKSDLTVIGSDQLFNEHVGRFFQERFSQTPQAIVALKILPGLGGGEKMSKSLGNYIGITDSPQDKFGKAMRIGDALILSYLEAYTAASMVHIEKIKKDLAAGQNPKEAKLFFAQELVRRYHGDVAAQRAQERFQKMFTSGGAHQGADIPVMKIEHRAWDIIALLRAHFGISSNAEARRLILQRAVEIDHKVIDDFSARIDMTRDMLIRVGKKQIVRAG